MSQWERCESTQCVIEEVQPVTFPRALDHWGQIKTIFIFDTVILYPPLPEIPLLQVTSPTRPSIRYVSYLLPTTATVTTVTAVTPVKT